MAAKRRIPASGQLGLPNCQNLLNSSLMIAHVLQLHALLLPVMSHQTDVALHCVEWLPQSTGNV